MRAVLLPVKAFREAKLRLATRLDAGARHSLAVRLAAGVLEAAGAAPIFVACDDDEVADWAVTSGATVLWTAGLGLSGAVTAAVGRLHERGFTLAVVAHADLPLAEGLDRLGDEESVTLVPDRRRDGTNVAVVPTGLGFTFAYGSGSFARHRAEAERLGIPCHVNEDLALATDLDIAGDIDELLGLRLGEGLSPDQLARLTWLDDLPSSR